MRKTILIAGLVAVLAAGGMFFIWPQSAQARPYYRSHHYWHRHHPLRVLPHGGVAISVGGFSFYYSEGMYYKPCHGEYVIVPPPVGACVPSLPPGCDTVFIQGAPYYQNDGVYYKQAPDGYTVVPVGLTKAIPVKAIREREEETTLVVNVPNKNGSYTPVTLQLAANGMYIGPQGEVYPTKPSMTQLNRMYAK